MQSRKSVQADMPGGSSGRGTGAMGYSGLHMVNKACSGPHLWPTGARKDTSHLLPAGACRCKLWSPFLQGSILGVTERASSINLRCPSRSNLTLEVSGGVGHRVVSDGPGAAAARLTASFLEHGKARISPPNQPLNLPYRHCGSASRF